MDGQQPQQRTHAAASIGSPTPTMAVAGIDSLRKLGYWAGLRFTIPLSMLTGHCGRAGFGVLMYHRCCDYIPGLAKPTWNVRPARLERQLTYLLNRGFEPWSLQRILDELAAGNSIPRHVFAVTFDDGYRCFYSRAYPILARLKIPTTLFLVTGLLDQPGKMPQDDWEFAGDPRVPEETYQTLTLEECDRLAEDPLIQIGSHTHTHQDFRGRVSDFVVDLRQSALFLQQRWGITNAPFAFPYGCSVQGYCTPEMMTAVRAAGFCCALTADSRIVQPDQESPFGWGRIEASDGDSGRALAAKLDNWFGAMRFLKKRKLSLSMT